MMPECLCGLDEWGEFSRNSCPIHFEETDPKFDECLMMEATHDREESRQGAEV
jgi:hypothetical protein